MEALLIEDDKVCLLSQKLLLENNGVRVDAASSAKEGIDLLNQKEFEGNLKPYDVILVDIKLPDFDGDHIAEVIKKTTDEEVDIPIVAITAYTEDLDQEELKHKGISAIIEKPLTQAKIQTIISLCR